MVGTRRCTTTVMMASEGKKNTQEGGLNCVCPKIDFTSEQSLDSDIRSKHISGNIIFISKCK